MDLDDGLSGIFRLDRAPVRDLEGLARASEGIDGVRRCDLSPGDRVVVATRNSFYALTATVRGTFEVAGGWFDRHGQGPSELAVAGCTAGGSALLADLVAAPGLFLEFANGVRTTRIRHVRHMRAAAS
ncbi:MAG: hypothetical protein R2991_00795 [Thermoanaerobaculia bacterium]